MKITKVIAVLALLLVAIGTASAFKVLDSVTFFGGVSTMANLETEGNSFDFSKLTLDLEFGVMEIMPNTDFPLRVFQYTSLTIPMSAENKIAASSVHTILGPLLKLHTKTRMEIGIGIGAAARYYDWHLTIDNEDMKYTLTFMGFGALLDFQYTFEKACAINFDLFGSYYLKSLYQLKDLYYPYRTRYESYQDIKYLKVGASFGLSILF